MEQLIISIGRENGSGGREIASRISEALNVNMYDVMILMEVAKEMNIDMDPGDLSKYDEAPRKFFSSRKIGEHTNSIEDILAYKQFEYLRKKADSGESFVVLGRCADHILKDYKGLVKIFVTADEDARIKRIAIRHNVDIAEAAKIIKKADKGRKQYYERYSEGIKWGDSLWHDITIKSNTLGIKGTVDVLVKYINEYKNLLYNQ